jgi:hypothetical protein
MAASRRAGSPASPWPAVAVPGPAGPTAHPGGVDRHFNRRRYDAARTIEASSGRLRQQTDLATLATELLEVSTGRWSPPRRRSGLDPPRGVVYRRERHRTTSSPWRPGRLVPRGRVSPRRSRRRSPGDATTSRLGAAHAPPFGEADSPAARPGRRRRHRRPVPGAGPGEVRHRCHRLRARRLGAVPPPGLPRLAAGTRPARCATACRRTCSTCACRQIPRRSAHWRELW